MNVLVIIESPFKAPAIRGYLGRGYKVMSSVGHVRDLPKSKLGVDIEHDFEPQYINIRGKGDVIKELRKAANAADLVLFATDPDREGEAIAWHLAAVLEGSAKKYERITFNEITKNAVKAAVKNPREINMDLVNAQQTRRILDRIVGYKISPILWKHIRSGLSAGRVQSVATRLIVEREEEIKAFVPEEYWNLTAQLSATGGDFSARFTGRGGKKLEVHDGATANEIAEAVKKSHIVVSSVKKALKQRRAQPPLITSTLTQEANKKLGFSSARTMRAAQELYEGISLGDKGTRGLITYMRTDSLRISDEARDAARAYIVERYGAQYYPKSPNVFKSRGNAQDAHEAIRPTNVFDTPESVADSLTPDQLKVYSLVWERFVASQMANAQLDTVVAEIKAGDYDFRAAGYTVRFNGFMAVSHDSQEHSEEQPQDEELGAGKLPELAEGEELHLRELLTEQKFTQPPPHYNEASMIKTLEELGIGRPSTFVPTINTIITREYVVRDGRALIPTKLGYETNALMKEYFSDIIDYGFTAKMEEDLDRIEQGEEDYHVTLRQFYERFEPMLENAAASNRDRGEPELSDLICEKCGSRMVVKNGRYGKFAACPNYPECRSTVRLGADGSPLTEKKVEVLAEEKCEKCGRDMVLRTGRYGQFYACKGYPECKNTRPVVADTGFTCPKCGKRLVYRKVRSKGGFYSCEGYPDCDFSTWDTPLPEKCPACGGMLVKNKQKKTIKCIAGCGYTAKDGE